MRRTLNIEATTETLTKKGISGCYSCEDSSSGNGNM